MLTISRKRSTTLQTFGILYNYGFFQVGLMLNGTHQMLFYADDVNILGDNIDTVACFASAGWMAFRNLKERDCNSSGTLRVLPPLPYPRVT
jgi:hypothetical protein